MNINKPRVEDLYPTIKILKECISDDKKNLEYNKKEWKDLKKNHKYLSEIYYCYKKNKLPSQEAM